MAPYVYFHLHQHPMPNLVFIRSRNFITVPSIRVPENKLEALNKTPPSLYAHVAPQYGEGVIGFLDVFHQLHCLVCWNPSVLSSRLTTSQSTIRQYTYRDEYDYSNVTAFRAPDDIVRGHIDHCIETIRKAIMCTSDVTPMLFIKDPKRPEGKKSDFNIRRKCRNYQKVQEWAMLNVGF